LTLNSRKMNSALPAAITTALRELSGVNLL
jgi:hypothetical protein